MKNNYRNISLILIFVFMLGLSINVFAANADCNGVFTQDILDILNDYIYKPIKLLTPVALILLTSLDFAKVVFSGKKEGMDKAKNNFLKRLVAALIIFFAPDVVKLIIDLIQNESIKSCLNKF